MCVSRARTTSQHHFQISKSQYLSSIKEVSCPDHFSALTIGSSKEILFIWVTKWGGGNVVHLGRQMVTMFSKHLHDSCSSARGVYTGRRNHTATCQWGFKMLSFSPQAKWKPDWNLSRPGGLALPKGLQLIKTEVKALNNPFIEHNIQSKPSWQTQQKRLHGFSQESH